MSLFTLFTSTTHSPFSISSLDNFAYVNFSTHQINVVAQLFELPNCACNANH